MNKSEKIVRDLLQTADIQANGDRPWDIQVRDDRFYDRILRDASLGLGEAIWMVGGIARPLTNSSTMSCGLTYGLKWRTTSDLVFQVARAKLTNRQSRQRAYEVGEQHYDLGNDLYRAMLDKRLNYTCAYWRDADNLDDAQEAKLELVCRKIGAHPGMRILELGCGWGSFAKYAAEKHGCQVLGVTIPKSRSRLAMNSAKACRWNFACRIIARSRGNITP